MNERIRVGEPMIETDLQPLPEDVRTHTMMDGWGHGDGRQCMFHARLRAWTPDGLNECLRDHESFSLPPDAPTPVRPVRDAGDEQGEGL